MTGGGGCCCRRPTKVSPAPGRDSEYQIVEIRPKRRLRIRHINPVPRDEKFEKEMENYLTYRRQGYPSSLVTSGPLVLPKRPNVSYRPDGPMSDVLPNSTTGSDSRDQTPMSQLHNWKVTGLQSKESTIISNSPLQQNDVHSASSVFVNMNQGQEHSSATPQGHARPSTTHNEEGHSATTHQDQAHHISAHDQSMQQQDTSLGKTENIQKLAGNDSVLFFLHGVGGSSDIWTPQLEYFANEGYEIVAPDLIGHGFSDAPSNAMAYHFDEILADVEEMFDKYCKRKNVIIAHSYGCSFAVVLGRRRARRVTKLVLISGGGPTPLNPQPGVFSLPVCVLGCVRPCVECTFKRSAFSSSKNPVISPEAAFAIPTYVLRHTMNGQIWPDGDELFHNWLMCPTLLIYGLQDQLVSLQEEKDMEQAIFQSRLVVIEDASHMVMIETPNEVNRLVKDFLLQSSQFQEDSSPTRDSRDTREARTLSRLSARSTKSARGSKTMR